MAKKINFKALIAESFEKNDAATFQSLIRSKLNEIYIKRQKKLISEVADPETKMFNAVSQAAKSFGGYDASYSQGIMTVFLQGNKAALDFANYLDEFDDVDSYEIFAVNGDDGSPVDLEDATGGAEIDYEFTVFFNTENVTFDTVEEQKVCKDDEMEYEDDSEDDSEAEDDDESEDDSEANDGNRKKVKVNNSSKVVSEQVEKFQGLIAHPWLVEAKRTVTFRDGLKKIKMQCPPGQKWNASKGKCEIMSSSENRLRHIQALKAAKKRVGKETQMQRKRDRSLRKRTAAGF